MATPSNFTGFDPRRFVLGLINQFASSNRTLWLCLKYIFDVSSNTQTELGTLATQTSWQFSLFSATPTIAMDIANYWYNVNLPVDTKGNPLYNNLYVSRVIISAKTVPTSDAGFDLLYSRDGGVTFVSLFTGISFILPTNIQTIGYGNMTVKTFFENDIFRLDCSDPGGSAGIEVKVLGSYQ